MARPRTTVPTDNDRLDGVQSPRLDGCGADIAGQRFGRLVARFAVRHHGREAWICECDCGGCSGPIEVRKLRSGHSKSCGCAQRHAAAATGKTNRKHGHAGRSRRTRTYESWSSAKQRCHNPRARKYQQYGGAGIQMCERWRGSFENFLADMGECPPGLTLDRWPDQQGDYAPGNCRWATAEQQIRNRSNSIVVDGRPIADLAAKAGITYGAMYRRLKRAGKL